MKGQMLGSRSLEDDISLAHSVHASSLQSEVSGSTGHGAAPPPTAHSPLMATVLPVVVAGPAPAASVAWPGPPAPLGFSCFFHQVRGRASLPLAPFEAGRSRIWPMAAKRDLESGFGLQRYFGWFTE